MPTKISNTNTNINRININIPKQRQPKITPKSVKKAEQDLQNLERQDRQIPYVSQAPSQFINPSIFGFNTTPINTGAIQEPEQQMQEPVRPMETQTETAITENDFLASPRSPRMAVAEPVNIKEFMPQRGDTPREPIPFRSSSTPTQRDVLALGYSQPQYSLPSDFQNRLAAQEGFQPSSKTFKPIVVGKMRDIQKQGRPDINQMAQNVKQAYRGEEAIVPFAKAAGTSPSYQQPLVFENMPLEEALPPAKKKGGGRPIGSKNKPKPKAVETQVGPSLAANVNTPEMIVKKVSKPKGALRGQKED